MFMSHYATEVCKCPEMVLWGDGLTDITLSHQYGESKGGEMRHYVDLEYIDTELHQKAQNIIKNEL